MKSLKMFLIVMVTVFFTSTMFAAGDGWLTDFAKAKKIATEKKLPILVDFSGSDWCGWCIRLDKEVFSKKDFLNYAKKNFVLLSLDFPRKSNQSAKEKAINNKIAQDYNIQGFPTILVLDASGKEIAKGGYLPGGPEAFIKFLEKIKSTIK